MSVLEVGCCGAYCGTCPAYLDESCKGCKVGYGVGGRDLSRAKCKIKKCCMQKKLESCADCPDFPCEILQEWYGKGYKYQRYEKAAEYIRKHGYKKFLEKTKKWRGAYGKLD